MLPSEQKRQEEKIETNRQSCPPALVRNLGHRTQRDRESKRNEKKVGERGEEVGEEGERVFDRRLKCNCAISFLFQHNEE